MARDRRRYPHPSEVPPEQLARLGDRIEESIVRVSGGDGDDLLGLIVREALETFIEAEGDLREAVSALTPRMGEIGEQQARRDFDADELSACFRAALVATQKGLAPLVGDLVDRDTLVRLREDLVTYLAELHSIAHVALVRSRRLLALSPDQRRRRLRALAFGIDSTTEIDRLATLEGLDPHRLLVAVVSVSAEIPAPVRAHADAFSNDTSDEILVPQEWQSRRLSGLLVGQAVVGPAGTVGTMPESMTLTRRAAQLLRDGVVSDARRVVPMSDLLGHLFIDGSPLLTTMSIAKHLGPFVEMPPARRLTLAELLLAVLEGGRPMNHVARDLGIPTQTAHSRIKTVRDIFGDALRDPTQRLELIIALRAVLPRWRRETNATY